MRMLACLVIGLGTLACSSGAEPRVMDDEPTFGGRGRVGSTRGGAVVLSHDERVAVATHRTSGVISVLHLDEEGSAQIAETIDVGVEAEPWAAVIGADDDSAYVLLRGEQRVVRVLDLHGAPKLDEQGWSTGAEPTAIAITPSGQRVYVANFGEGTISTFRTAAERNDQATDLNVVLARAGLLGALIESAPGAGDASWSQEDFTRTRGAARPGLAHPYALAITDDGDLEDEDEVLYATEFFSQPLAGGSATDPDLARQGLVYAIDVGTGQPLVDTEREQPYAPISLSALSTGFMDADGTPTSCFPNQLLAAAVEGERLYVTSVCASPRGPVDPGPGGSPENFSTLVHPVVFVIDTTTQREVKEAAAVLSRLVVDQHGEHADLRMPLISNDLALVPHGGGVRAYVSALGADAVFSVDFGRDGKAGVVGTAGAPFVDLRSQKVANAGRLPIGVALSRQAEDPFALAITDYSDVIAVLDLERAVVKQNVKVRGLGERVDSAVREGRRLFVTGLENWSHRGQAWSSCESCHPDGGSDGVVWGFARGPRRTISTAGTYYGDPDDPTRRVLLWTANVDEVHDVEAIARGVSGGAGGVAWKLYQSDSTPNVDCRLLYAGEKPREPGGRDDCPQQIRTTVRRNGLNGSLSAISRKADEPPCTQDAASCDVNARSDWDHIDAYIRSIEAPDAPTTLEPSYVQAGEALFGRMRCAACHGGPGWTLSRVFYEPGEGSNGAVPVDPPAAEPAPDLLAMMGSLRLDSYGAPDVLASLNQPLARALMANGVARATFRSWAPATATPAAELDYVYKGADQINCVLRSVGTYPKQPDDPTEPPVTAGVVVPGAPAVSESRRILEAPMPDAAPVYVDKPALGATGFNIPTLTGLALAGSYFHAGNARTLEELFDATFAQHHQHPAVNGQQAALTREDVRDLTSFLLSIDEDTAPVAVPMLDAAGMPFDPDLCAQR